MEFSTAKADDIPNIVTYYKNLYKENINKREDMHSHILVDSWLNTSNIRLYLLYEGDNLVSIIRVNIGENNKSHSAYMNVSTKLTYRNLGYAKKNMEYAMKCLRAEGIKILRVKVLSWNKPAIARVEKSGFILSGRIVMDHYDQECEDYIDILLYHKFL